MQAHWLISNINWPTAHSNEANRYLPRIFFSIFAVFRNRPSPRSHSYKPSCLEFYKEQKMFKTNILLQINIVTQQSLGHYAQYGHFTFLNSGLSVSDLGISWNIDFYFIFRLSLNLILRSKFPRQQKSRHIPVDPRFLFNDQRLSIESPLSKELSQTARNFQNNIKLQNSKWFGYSETWTL